MNEKAKINVFSVLDKFPLTNRTVSIFKLIYNLLKKIT